jgi:hypothetical protein
MGCEEDQNSATGLRWLRRAWSGVVERGEVQRVCRELLALHAEVAREHPELAGEPLYERIIARFTNSDPQQAKTVLNRAEESFAQWPVVRDVIFRDVVLYFVVSRSLDSSSQAAESRVDLTNVVHAIVPAEL